MADTDSDGKMNIAEFSIACKLINLKLRGFEVPPCLPPTLLASLTAVHPTPAPVVTAQPIIQSQPQLPTDISNVHSIPPPAVTSAIVPPIMPAMAAPHAIPTGVVLPLQTLTSTSTVPSIATNVPLIPGAPAAALPMANTAGIGVGVPLVGSGMPVVPPTAISAPILTSSPAQVTPIPSLIAMGTEPTSAVPGAIKPLNSQTPPTLSEHNTGATNTPRASIDKTISIESL